jgi:hypothetical protein
MGSVLGTIKDTVDEMRDAGHRIGVLGITSFRPFPLVEVAAALKNCKRFVVLEKSLAVGIGGIVDHQRAHGRHRHGPQGLHRGRRTRRPRHHHEILDRAVRESRARRTRPGQLPRPRLEAW